MEIILEAKAIGIKDGKNLTQSYRWVLHPSENSVISVERHSEALEEWIGAKGQWYLSTLEEISGDTIYLDLGQNWAVSGLKAAIAEAKSILQK